MSEVEVITACENVCRDFYWVGPVTEWLRNLAIVIGVGVAYVQLNAWRREHVSKRTAETAEQLLSVALNVKLAIASVRSVMEQVRADADDTRQEIIDMKLNRLASYKEDFERLRELQVLHEAYVGSNDVKSAVDELFDVRQEVYAALATLSGWNLAANPRPEHVELYQQLNKAMYSTGGQYDELTPRVDAAIETLSQMLLPEIRMERKQWSKGR
ncbi:hypothetical protein [Ruegeria atlantica]|uniref:hypothetical protein n=1 Tax=Ruegeria atlantica TaxID=81569 RepID=UPI001479A34D|nr:hypothetical protein [Ruegeria atlantica]